MSNNRLAVAIALGLGAYGACFLALRSAKQRKHESKFVHAVSIYQEKMSRNNYLEEFYNNSSKVDFLRKVQVMWDYHEENPQGFSFKGGKKDVQEAGNSTTAGSGAANGSVDS